MPHTDPEKRKAYHAKYMKEVWYPRNKEKHISFVRRNKDRVSQFIEQYKRERSCVDCGFSGKEFPYVLDFDHKNIDTVKKFNIASWRHSVLSIEAVMQEMEKCELVCANCHRKRTFREKSSS
ncbi:MAG TPA: hypothetical protein VGN56_00955 [Candidatus Paceibacterota bacterium]|jgi:hypothetical protein|nr:hypothetical protein [Candidatus Paceibacterota bacterium]